MTRDSFIFYASFYEAMRCLDDAAYVAVSKAVNEYALYGNEIELDGTAKGFFQLIKPQIDANNKRYENGKKGAEYGKLGGRPRKNNPDNNPEENPYKTPNAKKTAFKNPKENPKETPSVEIEVKPQEFAAKKGVEITAGNGNFENADFIDNEQTKTPKNPKQTPNVNENVNDNVNNNSLKGDFENSAVADATTPTTKNDFSANPIENPASPEKEKGCAEKGKAKAKTIEERANDFKNELESYKGSYSSEMLDAFYKYWSEHNAGGKKMRKEMEKTFDVERRLEKWAKNDREWNKKNATTAAAGTNDVESIWKK